MPLLLRQLFNYKKNRKLCFSNATKQKSVTFASRPKITRKVKIKLWKLRNQNMRTSKK